METDVEKTVVDGLAVFLIFTLRYLQFINLWDHSFIQPCGFIWSVS